MDMTREEAIQVLTKIIPLRKWREVSEALDLAIESLQTESEWIPVSERLPSEGRYYLCCNKGYLPFVAHYYDGQWHDFDVTTLRVDAWMPLPKPYGERREP